jgi:hypothetical protein
MGECIVRKICEERRREIMVLLGGKERSVWYSYGWKDFRFHEKITVRKVATTGNDFRTTSKQTKKINTMAVTKERASKVKKVLSTMSERKNQMTRIGVYGIFSYEMGGTNGF